MQSKIQAASVLGRVASVTGLPVDTITGPRRTNRVAYARFLAVHMLHRQFPGWTQEELSLAVGAADHGMANHALKRVPELAAQVPQFAAMLAELESQPIEVPEVGMRISAGLTEDLVAAFNVARSQTAPDWLLAAADSLEGIAVEIRIEVKNARELKNSPPAGQQLLSLDTE